MTALRACLLLVRKRPSKENIPPLPWKVHLGMGETRELWYNRRAWALRRGPYGLSWWAPRAWATVGPRLLLARVACHRRRRACARLAIPT